MASKRVAKYLPKFEFNPKGGGRVRVWQSVDIAGSVCFDVFQGLSVCRLTRAELAKLITKLTAFNRAQNR